MISNTNPHIPIGSNFDKIGEIETNSHLRINTLDIRLISELRKIKYDVGPDGIIIWDNDNGYNSIIKSRKILDQWINLLDITEVKLYDIVLPQEVTPVGHKLIFFIEEPVITQHTKHLPLQPKVANCRTDKLEGVAESSGIVLREGTFLICY